MNNSNDNTNNKATRGSISQILLSALLSGDKYGYEICKDIEQRTNGKLVLKQPSLYSSLRRMEEQELIKSYWGDSDIGGRRHYYSITEKGKQKYEKHKDDWDSFDALIDSLPENFNTKNSNLKTNKNTENNKIDKISDGSTYVVNQESLFNTNNYQSKEQIKKIEPEEESSSFLQFDLFNESASIINKKTVKEVPSFEKYTNKFADIDDHKDTIEPTELQQFEKVTDEDVKLAIKEPSNEDVFEEEIEDKKYDDAHILSESETGQQSINLDDFMKANFGFATSNYKTESKEEKEKTSINFVSLLNENEGEINEDKTFEITHDEDRPNLDKFSEVLKDDERIDFDGIKYQKPKMQEYSSDNTSPQEDENIVSEEVVSTYQDDKTDSLEYQNVIGKLYSNINQNDPYEISKLKKFGRLPEDDIQKQENDDIVEDDTVEVLDESLETKDESFIKITKEDLILELKNEGVKLKEYKKLSKHTKKGNYINYYKLKICNAWILWLFMAIETLVTYFVVKNNGLLGVGHENFYYWSLGIISLYPLYYTLTYLFNKDRKIESNFKINISIFNKFLATLICIVFIFSINLFIGMTSLNQIAYLSFWLLPTILSTNFILSSIIYFVLLKTKKFYA